MALVGILQTFRRVNTFSITRYKTLDIDFDDTKDFTIVDIHPLYSLSFLFGVIQIHHSSSLSPPLWRGKVLQIRGLGSHVLRLWLSIYQSFDYGLWLHSDRQVLDFEGTRPLSLRYALLGADPDYLSSKTSPKTCLKSSSTFPPPETLVLSKANAKFCIEYKTVLTYGSMNFISDVIIFILPLPMVWRLQLSRESKIGVTFVFMGGFM